MLHTQGRGLGCGGRVTALHGFWKMEKCAGKMERGMGHSRQGQSMSQSAAMFLYMICSSNQMQAEAANWRKLQCAGALYLDRLICCACLFSIIWQSKPGRFTMKNPDFPFF